MTICDNKTAIGRMGVWLAYLLGLRDQQAQLAHKRGLGIRYIYIVGLRDLKAQLAHHLWLRGFA
jgi:hypothetical protein